MGSKSGQPAARLGDIDTGHPPSPPTPVITASSNIIINGKPAARKGDMLAPHHPGVRIITEGSGSCLLNGRPAARVTDAINCGGKMAIGSGDVIIGDKPSPIKPRAVKIPPIEFGHQQGNTTKKHAIQSSSTKGQQANNAVLYTPPPNTSLSKNNATEYWTEAENNADNFPAAFGARLMRLNAEAGYSIAEGAVATYETLTDWDRFKAAAKSMKDSVVNYEETFNSLKESAEQFADLPAEQRGEAAYKMLVGTLAGGGVGKANKLFKSKEKTADINAKRFEAKSLSEAQNRLAERRQQIQANGYQAKYSDDDLAYMAQHGDVGNERFQARFMEANYLNNRNTPNDPLSGTMGMPMEGASGKGAKYWSTSFDQIEDADSDPKLISEKLGLEYNPDKDYALVIVDAEKAAPLSGVKSVPATFDEVGQFANTELPNHFPKSFTDKAMTSDFQDAYAQHYQGAVDQGYLPNQWSKNTEDFEDYLKSTGMNQDTTDLMTKRMVMHDKIGNNQDYLGNGLTKNLHSASGNEYGAVETLNFERKEVNLKQLHDAGAITVIKGLSPL